MTGMALRARWNKAPSITEKVPDIVGENGAVWVRSRAATLQPGKCGGREAVTVGRG